MPTPVSTITALVLLTGGTLLSSCGGGASHSSNPSSRSGPTSTVASSYKTSYLAIVGPYDEAVGNFTARSQQLPAKPSSAELAALARPVLGAISTSVAALSAIEWPGQVETAVQQLLVAERTAISDLHGLESGSTSVGQLTQDLGIDSEAAALVRADLACPQMSAGRSRENTPGG